MPEPTVVGKTTKRDHPSLWVSFRLSYLFWRKRAVTHKIQPEKQPFGIFRLFRILDRHRKETLFHHYSHGLFVSAFVLFILGPFVLATLPCLLLSLNSLGLGPHMRCHYCTSSLPMSLVGLVQNRTSLYLFGT